MARIAQQPSSAKSSTAKSAIQETHGSTTISGSVRRSVAMRLGQFLKRTRWQQSRVLSDALCLYVEIPPVTLQRMHELEDSLGEVPVREAVIAAVERAVDRLEWSVTAQATAQELAGRLPANITEPQLVAAANDAIAASRAARRRCQPDTTLIPPPAPEAAR